MSVRIHPTAIIEQDVTIGEGSSIWDNVHIRFGTKIGQQCIVGGKTIIAYEVQIGDRVKLNSAVYICHGVTLEDGVMVMPAPCSRMTDVLARPLRICNS